MPQSINNNPLQGVTLEQMLITLAETLGWDAMGRAVAIRCFTDQPSVASSLKFLRRTPWARARVEDLYVRQMAKRSR